MSRTEYEAGQLNATAKAWRERARQEVDDMLERSPQETANEGKAMLISELVDDE